MNSSCLPDASEWSIGAKYSLLEDHLDALKWHVGELEIALKGGPNHILQHQAHYHEIYKRVQGSLELLLELGKHPQDDLQGLIGSKA